MILEPGSKLGPYEIAALLGAGGMGEVYRAKDTRLDRTVALKVLPEEFFEDKERGARFEREAKLLAALNHPNIAGVFAFEEISGRHLLAMELLEGETLRERLRDGPLPIRNALDLAVQMAKGLAAAHEKGIVHRDLKPENVFITKDARVKILDFGLAKLTRTEVSDHLTKTETVSALTEAGAVMGTVGYMSPEQVRGEPVDHRSDIFSFGTIVYEMLSGKNPFRKLTTPETMTAILKEEPPSLPEPDLVHGLPSVVGRCLEKKRESRFQSSEDLVFAVADLGARRAISGGGTTPVPARRSTSWIALAAVLVLAAAGAYILGMRAGVPPVPSFRRLTFRRGHVASARFAPDGQTVLYGATWDGNPVQVFSTRAGNPETSPLGPPNALLLGVSSKGEMALSLSPILAGYSWHGTLARAPLAGGAPREVLEGVTEADWAPDGSALAVVRETSNRTRLEYPVGTLLYESKGRIGESRISRDGALVAFLDHPSILPNGDVAVIDRTGKKTILSAGWDAASGLAWSARGDEVWFTAAKAGHQGLHAVSLAGRTRLVARWGGNWTLHDIAPDGRALVTQVDWRQTMIGSSPAGERDLTWLDWSNVRDLSPDGSQVLFDEYGEAVTGNHTAYIRRTDDGSPAIRLGNGTASALSPDGKWALVERAPAGGLVLLPTGPGEERNLPHGTVEEFRVGITYYSAAFFPDGNRILFVGAEKGGKKRLFIQDIDGGLPRPFGPEGLTDPHVSPDGRWVAAMFQDSTKLHVLTSQGEPRQSINLEKSLLPIQWSSDGSSIFARQREGTLTRIYRVDLATGKKELWREIRPPDPAGILRAGSVTFITPDGKTRVSSFFRSLTDLYVVEGLK